MKIKNLIVACFFTAMVVIVFPINSTYAAITAFVVEDNTGNLYEYTQSSLIKSYATKLLGRQAVLYEHYIKKGDVRYVYDNADVYIEYKNIISAYAKALLTGKKFDIDAYIASGNLENVSIAKVNVVTVKDGKIKITEKEIVDVVKLALEEINAAEDKAALRNAIEKHADEIDLNIELYQSFNDNGKNLVIEKVWAEKDESFPDIETVKSVFAAAIENNTIKIVLQEINAAADAGELKTAIETRADTIGLNLANYQTLSNTGKNTVIAGVLARRNDSFPDIGTLKTVFLEEVDEVSASYDNSLEIINAAENVSEFKQSVLDAGGELNLDMDSYNLIIAPRKDRVFSSLYEAVPFDSVENLKNSFKDAVADVLTSYVIVSYRGYSHTLSDVIDIQMCYNPKIYKSGWVDALEEEVEYYLDPKNFIHDNLISSATNVIITGDVLNVRDKPTTEGSKILGSVTEENIYEIEETREVLEGTETGTEGYWYKISTKDYSGWICGLYADLVAESYNQEMFQFLTLSGSSGAALNDIKSILDGQGILSGTEESFFTASRENNINEIFLTALAMHETGHGTSQLAMGVVYTPEDETLESKKVYNMFGIGATAPNAVLTGAEYAYEHEWFTPEEAIIGGAYFATRYYVNNPSRDQNTLYKMRWNPAQPGEHQYATDVNWAVGQVNNINLKEIYDQVKMYNLHFDIPQYEE